MRLLLATLFSALMLAGCQSLGSPGYRIDEQATEQAQWKPGEIVAEGEVDWRDIGKHNFYRKFIGITNQGYAVVQDFYADSDNKFSDPFVVKQPERIGDIGLLWEEIIKNSSTLLDGELTLWYENGQKRFEVHFQDGKPHGLWTWWDENGQKKFESHYQDGKAQGLWTLWYENGQKQEEVTFLGDKAQGLSTYWYESGQKWYEGHYQDGNRQGLWTYWDENGQKREERHYQDGMRHGLWTEWHKNGQKWMEGYFQDDLEQGLLTEWDENGKKISETLFESGEVVRLTYFF